MFVAAGCSCGGVQGDPDGAIAFPDAGAWDAGPAFVDASRPDAGPAVDAGGGCLADEVCDNGLDDNCDGSVDEECPCLPGSTAMCFRGTAAQLGVGVCMAGSMTCMDGLEFGTWGPCSGDVLPETEICDVGGADENCDGASNEGCECSAEDTVVCGSDVGECRPGTQDCVDGRLAECVGGAGPVGEACNNLDDDCDGLIDEGISRVCGSDTGECRTGIESCNGGRFEACVGGLSPSDEICDGLDNDCDGMADETLDRGCGSSVGACLPGTQTCSAATWSMCSGETLPMLETCDNTDEDCDGRVDEGVTRACGSSTGICRPGTETCGAGSFGSCMGGTGPGTEVCDGVLDENCDGTVDEGCGCTTGTTRPCGSDTGECIAGAQTCDASGSWAPCVGATGPVPEVCNMLDDDCDGMADEDGICPTAPPIVMCPGDMTADVLDTLSLSGSGSDPDGGSVTFEWSVTLAPVGSTSTPASPMNASTNFYLDASGQYILQLCVIDDEGERACCDVNITSTPPGAIHIEVSWDTIYGDVDAHLLNVTESHPDGWWTTNDCHFLNRTPDWGPAGVDANPTLDLDDTDGYGPENITINTNPAAGTYTVGLHYFCSHSVGTSPAPGDGPTSGTVRIFCDGALAATYTGISLTETDEWITIAELDYPSCRVTRRNTTTNGTSILPASFTAPRHCEISCSSAADCPAGERCVRAMGGGRPRNICYL